MDPTQSALTAYAEGQRSEDGLLADLTSLYLQATSERSHYYVGKCAQRAIAELTRLTERCEAYKGQVKAGAAEIARLTGDEKTIGSIAWALAQVPHLTGGIIVAPDGTAHTCSPAVEALYDEARCTSARNRLRQFEAAPAPIPVSDELRRLSEKLPPGEFWVNGDTADLYVSPHGSSQVSDQIMLGKFATGEHWQRAATFFAMAGNLVRASLTTGGDDGR